VAVYDVAEEDGRPWIVMELVPSQSLDQVLVVEGRLPPARAGRIGQQLLSALAAAHSAGVLHRDVKPSNVLIATNRIGDGWDERAVLTDFGIAQFEGDPRLTQTGMVMGSPGFTAPERIRGSDATPASDLWSLGATIYAAVEGRGPYEQRGGAITTMSAIINEDAPIAPHARQLAPVIAALLRRDPSSRPSAAAAARMFAQALPQLPETTDDPQAKSHPPTVRSAYVPAPAEPLASTPVTAPDGARSGKPAPAAKEPAAKDRVAAVKAPAAKDRVAAVKAPAEPAKEAQQAREATETPSAEKAAEAEEAASVASADSAEETDSADAVPAAAAPEPRPAPEAESEPAAATAEFKVSAPDAADVPAPGAATPAEAPAGEAKAAAALLEAPPAAEAAGARAADTVIPGKEPIGYQPTEVSVPAARITPPAAAQSAAAPAKSAESTPDPAKSAEPKPESSKAASSKAAESTPAPPKPGPTFTAAKPTGRAVPTFSAASPAAPARPVRASRPVTPPAEQRPAYGPNAPAPGYPPPGGGTTPFPPSGANYGPAAGPYAGPSQLYPDLARQYPPGSGGGRAGRGRGPSRRILWLVVAVIVAAAIGVGTALALNNNGGGTSAGGAGAVPSVADTPTGFKSIDALNNSSTALPAADWSTQTVTAAAVHSAAAGFSIDVPPGWTKTPKGLATDFNGPGDLLLEVDLTQQSTSDMLTAAKQVEAATHFRDYKRLNLQREPVRHAPGAVWKFNWTPAGGVKLTVDDIFFAQQTSAGVQDYAVYLRSPSSTFGSKSLPLFEKMLRTFQTVPAA
jgi:hypothetical protein